MSILGAILRTADSHIFLERQATEAGDRERQTCFDPLMVTFDDHPVLIQSVVKLSQALVAAIAYAFGALQRVLNNLEKVHEPL